MDIELFFIILGALSFVAFIYIYGYLIRPSFLKHKFLTYSEKYKKKHFVREHPFALSPFMVTDGGSITEGAIKGIVFYQSMQMQALGNIWYVVLIKPTHMANGIHGTGYVKNTIINVRTFNDLKKIFNSRSASKMAAELELKNSPECIEVHNGWAYLYYKCGSIIGSKAINIGFNNI
jgi:hypothetical protein